MRLWLCWDVLQRRLVVCYRRFEISFRFHLQGLSSTLTLEMGPTGCPETSISDYQYTLRNISEERSSEIFVT